MSTQDVLVKVENLFRYYDRHCAVNDLSFELRKGEILGFLGPNGAGKSSTMQMLSGNLAPSAGRIWIGGVDILDEPKRAKAAIGYLPEQPPLYEEMTVDEYLTYCARLNRIARNEIDAAREAAKQRCGLADAGSRLIGNLSKGYQQRVGIAQAIIHSPAVVILDEPTVGLDPIQIREIRALITELGREHSVIISTHILPEVQMLCDRVQIINRGRLVYSDSIANLDARMHSTSLILGLRHPPAVNELAAISDVGEIEALDGSRFRIRHKAAHSPAESLATRAAEAGWGLFELTPEHISLEQIFVDLTTGEEGAGEPADTEEAA